MAYKFTYGTYEFGVNPEHMRFLVRNNIRLFSSPVMDSKAQNVGKVAQVLQVKGTLFENIDSQYNFLYQQARLGTSNTLSFPPFFTFGAMISKLEVQMNAQLDTLDYEIEFVEG